MSVRSSIGNGISNSLIRVAKVFGPGTPPAIEAAEAQQGMGPVQPFSPGEPIGPYDGYSRTPRSHDFVTGFNIATRPRTHERVSFDTLRSLIDAYDIAQACIWHRIDSLRSVRYRLVPADWYSGDVSDAVETAMKVLRKPDGKHNFKSWFAKWMYDVLAYDAGALYRLRNRRGDAIGLLPVDGTSLAPLLDYWGNPPDAPAPWLIQYANGVPWNWLTRQDMIYEPFRPVNNSPYGRAPIESILLNANTDLRFQVHFLGRFTSGNVPEAFASAPETWTPDQIENWQTYWDSFMYGDQSQKHQIKWMPGGSTISWTNEQAFTDQFSLFLMRKTLAAYHMVPTDLGFTDSANYSTGESQADVVHKVGELPLMEYTEEILSQFLVDDLKLPLKFEWDRGEDQDDRLVQAQADDIYIKNGTVGTEEIREMRYGLPQSRRPVPRFIFSSRGGPVPLNSLMAVAGEIDPETGAPAEGAALPHTVFTNVEGVVPNPPMLEMPLAEKEYGPSALPPAPPPQPGAPVAKEGETAGITADTGVYGYDGPGERDEDEDEDEVAQGLAEITKELAAFKRFSRARRKQGEWRDFRFDHMAAGEARRLNAEGREQVAKAANPGPKAPEAPGQQPPVQSAWPGWDLDLRTAAYWAPLLAAALAGAFGIGALVRAWMARTPVSDANTKPERIRDLTEQARDWLADRDTGMDTAITGIMRGVLTDGYAIGTASADAAAKAAQAGQQLGSIAADMGSWTPGASKVARELAGQAGNGQGLRDLLDEADVRIKSIADSRIGDLAKVLAEGAERGDSAEDLAAAIEGMLSNPSRAQMIVMTELARAANNATAWQYRFHGIRNVIWATAEDDKVCPECDANEAAGPRPLNDGPQPPAHPLCRCALLPA